VAGADGAHVREVAARAEEDLRHVVEPVVYAEGTTTMEEVVGEALVEHGWKIAVAESCTGGLLAKRLTDTPGSSRYFERGFVTYSNASKTELLGVKPADLEKHGAVSGPVVEQMAAGARTRAGVDVGVGITGIAGPDGGSPGKPVGTVYIGLATERGVAARHHRFMGTRATIRERSVQAALDLVRRELQGLSLDARLEQEA